MDEGINHPSIATGVYYIRIFGSSVNDFSVMQCSILTDGVKAVGEVACKFPT